MKSGIKLHLGIILQAALMFWAFPAAADLVIVDSAGDEIVTLTDADLAAMPQASLSVEHEHEDGLNEYSGPLARDVLALVGAGDDGEVVLAAINDYAVTIPAEDFFNYPVLFATHMNGEALSPREKGPIWVMYPSTDFPELQNEIINGRMIWQLVRMELK